MGVVGRYEILKHLATGGMAEVYLAIQRGLHGFARPVVIKRILPHLACDRDFVQMFLDEARLAARLHHPNIVQILDLGSEDGEYFIAMELLEGENLAELALLAEVDQETPFPPLLAAAIGAEVAEGLEYAHTLQDASGNPLHLVHRDVSPQNIVVLWSGEVKIIDFGVARAASQLHATDAGVRKGKLHYMSPEQCQNKAVDARTDVFALGVVLWELLAGERLRKGDSEGAVVWAITAVEPPPLAAFRPVPPDLTAVVEKALEKDPACRFQSTGEMAAALRDCLRAAGEQNAPSALAAFVRRVAGERIRAHSEALSPAEDPLVRQARAMTTLQIKLPPARLRRRLRRGLFALLCIALLGSAGLWFWSWEASPPPRLPTPACDRSASKELLPEEERTTEAQPASP